MHANIDNRKNYYENLNEVIRKFSPEFKEKYMRNPTAHKTVEYLARNGDIYNLLEQLIDNAELSHQTMHRVISNSTGNVFGV